MSTAIAKAYVPQDYGLIEQLKAAKERLRTLVVEYSVSDPAWRLVLAIRVLTHWPEASFNQYCITLLSGAESDFYLLVDPELHHAAVASWNEVCVAVSLWDPLGSHEEIVFAIEVAQEE